MIEINQLFVPKRLQYVSAELAPGQLVCLLGANGAGKSSLLAAIAGLLTPSSGDIRLFDQPIKDYSLAQLAQFRCFQEQHSISQFELTVQEALNFFTNGADLPHELETALEINQFSKRKLNTLSGGECRRVHIARVILQIWPAIEKGKGVVLLDEPIQGLDFKHQHLIFRLLQQIAVGGSLVLLSHHDLNLARRYAQRILLLQEGEVIADGDCSAVMNKVSLEKAFDCKIDVFDQGENSQLFQSYL